MGGQNDQIAGNVGCEEPVEAEKADDVGGSGNQAQNEREGPIGQISRRRGHVQQTRAGGRGDAHSTPPVLGTSFSITPPTMLEPSGRRKSDPVPVSSKESFSFPAEPP